MKPDPDWLPYVERGLITRRQHNGFSVWNYTPECQCSKAWNDVTLAARGVVTWDETGEVVARPFGKFFNVGEVEEGWPAGPFTAHEKLDGSLAIGFRFRGEDHWTTRGSMASEQAEAARRVWSAVGRSLPEGATVLCEILCPESRVVVSYDGPDRLVLLAVRNTQTGAEAPPILLGRWATRLGVEPARQHHYPTVETMLRMADEIGADREGWVLRWDTSAGTKRLKVKGKAYMRAHRLLQSMTEARIAEAWRDGKLGDFATLADDHKEFIDGVVARCESAAERARGVSRVRADRVRHLLPDFRAVVDALGGPQSERFPQVMALLRGKRVDWRALAAKEVGARQKA